MQIPPDSVKEFMAIYKKEVGEELTYAEAEDASANLLGLFKLLIEIDREQKE